MTQMSVAAPAEVTAKTPTPAATTIAGIASRRELYLYTGLHTVPEQSPHYAASLTYGR
jgi:hypothetical protein